MNPIRMVRVFGRVEYGHTFEGVAYSEDGGSVWRWHENDQVIPLDACRDYAIPCDGVAQAAARDREVIAFLARYRQLAAEAGGPTQEEVAEARAAHGAGVTLSNVVTGRTFTT